MESKSNIHGGYRPKVNAHVHPMYIYIMTVAVFCLNLHSQSPFYFAH